MIKELAIIMILIVAGSCVELYDFQVDQDNTSLVIEGEISNMSFNAYQELPADGRYFTVKLSRTGNVANERRIPVGNARVILTDDSGNQWDYTTSEMVPGHYFLYEKDFFAEEGKRYRLKVILQEGELYESDWEKMPEAQPGPMGGIDFEEVLLQKYSYLNMERILTEVRGVDVNVDLPMAPIDAPVYYKWSFSATWVFRASLVSATSDIYRCWITNPYYLSDYILHQDNIGGYRKNLFFLQVDGNDRIYDRISILINQYSVSEKYYNYWNEIQEQDQRKGLFDPPPYNLLSNLHAEDPDLQVFGYFGVVREQGIRWDFSKDDLSYPVKNTWMEFCNNPNILAGSKPQCYNCLNYGNGIPTNIKPWWWDE
jgi:hypothetical protein